MRVSTRKEKIAEIVNVPGLLSGTIEHELKESKASFEYIGPKITQDVWVPVLEFFRDTFKDTNSECQVRLYVNVSKNCWAAWAFPQKKGTFMQAEELAGVEFEKQRQQFKESDGWQYLGTAHHHCRAIAFQSGTDRTNETGQDGLHITIGKLDERQFDIHARFYFKGVEYAPDMSRFFDIGEPWKSAPPGWCIPDLIARFQMTTPPPLDAVYPDEWKANLIDFKPVVAARTEIIYPADQCSSGHTPHIQPVQHGPYNGGAPRHQIETSIFIKREIGLNRALRIVKSQGLKSQDIESGFTYLEESRLVKAIIKAAIENECDAMDIVREYHWRIKRAELEAVRGAMAQKRGQSNLEITEAKNGRAEKKQPDQSDDPEWHGYGES